jgi:spore maturation protein CgeB
MGNNNHYQFPITDFRKQMVDALYQSFGADFGVFGIGWQRSDGNFMGNQPDEAAVYRGSKIAINCSHFDLERYSSDRILRIMGTGVFCLSKHFPGYEKDYENKKHLVIWNTIDDLLLQCHYYLKHEEERKTIAGNGLFLAHAKDTFSHMAENIKTIYQCVS